MKPKNKNIEKRLKIIEEKLHLTEHLKGTSSRFNNFCLVLTFGWLALLVSICYTIYRFFRVMFMSRDEQAKRKKYYLKGEFNALEYICSKIEED